jgi:hypothetical protein
MPDVIIWMIKAERERIAYCRIPANELLYFNDENERGEKCGKTIDVNLKVCDKKTFKFAQVKMKSEIPF